MTELDKNESLWDRTESLSATVELQRRQLDYLLYLMQQLGFAQKGWESMEIWEQYGK